MLSKDIWAGHPCCAFAISHAFARTYPNAFLALFKAIVDATHFASKEENRKAIAEAIAPKNYLNQPVTVLEHRLPSGFSLQPSATRFPVNWDTLAMLNVHDAYHSR
jgi:nitrate/nitrite transport system substrate-binding protein